MMRVQKPITHKSESRNTPVLHLQGSPFCDISTWAFPVPRCMGAFSMSPAVRLEVRLVPVPIAFPKSNDSERGVVVVDGATCGRPIVVGCFPRLLLRLRGYV